MNSVSFFDLVRLGRGKKDAPPVLLYCAIYLAVNCVQPLLVDVVKYNGGAAPSTFIYLLPTYYGMLFLKLIKPTKKSVWECDWKHAIVVAASDLLHQLLEKAGLVYAGSAVYMVVGSSSIVWTAILSQALVGRRQTPLQWGGIALVCGGLALKALGIPASLGNEEFLGAVLVFGAAFLHAFTYVRFEALLSSNVESENLLFQVGLINGGVLTLWTALWTAPQWDVLVAANVEAKQGSWTVIGICFAALLVAAVVRSASLFFLLREVGAVKAGILKGLRAATVFVLSHFLFCSLQESQCLTPLKATSAAVCVLGVVVHSMPATALGSFGRTFLRVFGLRDKHAVAGKASAARKSEQARVPPGESSDVESGPDPTGGLGSDSEVDALRPHTAASIGLTADDETRPLVPGRVVPAQSPEAALAAALVARLETAALEAERGGWGAGGRGVADAGGYGATASGSPSRKHA